MWLSNELGNETTNFIAGPSASSKTVPTEPSKLSDENDTEGSFVFSLRAFYRTLPNTIGRKQLAGLLAYGMRTYELRQEQSEDEKSKKLKNVKYVHQAAYGGKYNLTLSETQSPTDLCSCVRDSIIGSYSTLLGESKLRCCKGLLNAYRIGYTHRRLTIDSIVKSSPQTGYVLAK